MDKDSVASAEGEQLQTRYGPVSKSALANLKQIYNAKELEAFCQFVAECSPECDDDDDEGYIELMDNLDALCAMAAEIVEGIEPDKTYYERMLGAGDEWPVWQVAESVRKQLQPEPRAYFERAEVKRILLGLEALRPAGFQWPE